MIEQITVTSGEHPELADADYHFRIDVFTNGAADLLATNHGGGWGESGPADDIIRSARRLAWDLSDAGHRIVISYHGMPPPRRNHLRRVK